MKRIISFLLTLLLLAGLLCACENNKPLALDRTELSMTVGDSAELSAGDAARVNWLSSDNSVVTVSGGKVVAKSAGQATVTASLENGEQAVCSVTVTDKLINLITLDVRSARIEEDKTIQLSASYAPADATDKKLSWQSSDESIAAVDKDGYVTGISEGTATITCRSANGVEASCTVIVEKTILPTEAPTHAPTAKPTAPTEPTAPSEDPTKAEKDHDDDDSDEEQKPKIEYTGGMVFPESSDRYLSASEVEERLDSMSGSPVSDSFAQDAVNEIYARHGYIFRSASIRAYYEAQSWYHPDPSYDGSITEVEQYNTSLFNAY